MKATAKYRSARQASTKVTIPRFMDYFRQFSKKQQLAVVKQINEAAFSEQWKVLDKYLPDLNISNDDIMREIKAVRNAR